MTKWVGKIKLCFQFTESNINAYARWWLLCYWKNIFSQTKLCNSTAAWKWVETFFNFPVKIPIKKENKKFLSSNFTPEMRWCLKWEKQKSEQASVGGRKSLNTQFRLTSFYVSCAAASETQKLWSSFTIPRSFLYAFKARQIQFSTPESRSTKHCDKSVRKRTRCVRTCYF